MSWPKETVVLLSPRVDPCHFRRETMKPDNVLARVNLAERLIATKGRPSGFDYLRLGLAISVVMWHTTATTYGLPVKPRDDLWPQSPLHALFSATLPMFFALSGYLVAGRLERSKTILTFIGFRVVRIYSALAGEGGL